MFSDKKRYFPPGTFIAKPLRIMAIIQLCIAFTVLTSYAGYPFLGELYTIKSKKAVYEAVMGNGDSQARSNYNSLPFRERKIIEEDYGALQSKLQRTAWEKLKRSINILIFDTPPFAKAWLTFAILIPILLLLRIEGAALAAWLLPFIVIAYGLDNYYSGYSNLTSRDHELFPTEQYITDRYLDGPLSSSILEQKEQLVRGWRLYLIYEWAEEAPSPEDSVFTQQAKKGEFRFNLARLTAMKTDPNVSDSMVLRQKESPILLIFYLIWNLFFAWFINKKRAQEPSMA